MNAPAIRSWSPPRLFRVATALGFLLIYVQLAALVVYSFYAPVAGKGSPHGWTLYWYAELFRKPDLFRAVGLSLWIALWAATASTVLGVFAALAIQQKAGLARRVSSLVAKLTYTDLLVPELVLGLALLVWFSWIRLTLGRFSIILAHVVLAMPYAAVVVLARLRKLDPMLEEAARDLGASPWQTFRRVKAPLLLPALISSWLITFTLSFDDFVVSFFTAGVGTNPLPLKLYSMIRFGLTADAYAISTIIFFLTLGLILLAARTFLRSTMLFRGS